MLNGSLVHSFVSRMYVDTWSMKRSGAVFTGSWTCPSKVTSRPFGRPAVTASVASLKDGRLSPPDRIEVGVAISATRDASNSYSSIACNSRGTVRAASSIPPQIGVDLTASSSSGVSWTMFLQEQEEHLFVLTLVQQPLYSRDYLLEPEFEQAQ